MAAATVTAIERVIMRTPDAVKAEVLFFGRAPDLKAYGLLRIGVHNVLYTQDEVCNTMVPNDLPDFREGNGTWYQFLSECSYALSGYGVRQDSDISNRTDRTETPLISCYPPDFDFRFGKVHGSYHELIFSPKTIDASEVDLHAMFAHISNFTLRSRLINPLDGRRKPQFMQYVKAVDDMGQALARLREGVPDGETPVELPVYALRTAEQAYARLSCQPKGEDLYYSEYWKPYHDLALLLQESIIHLLGETYSD